MFNINPNGEPVSVQFINPFEPETVILCFMVSSNKINHDGTLIGMRLSTSEK